MSQKERSAARRVRVAITMGDPAGIGPEVIASALRKTGRRSDAVFFVIGDLSVLDGYGFVESGAVRLIDLKTIKRSQWNPGAASKITAYSSIAYLKEAVAVLKSGSCDALVTGPISKESVRRTGFSWPGQTEFLASAFNVREVEMVFVGEHLKVALATRHMALKKVLSGLSRQRITACGRAVFYLLKKYFALKNPRVAVCGLNPHAGEGGMFGDEEVRLIAPAIDHLNNALGHHFFGPFSADTIFHQAMAGAFDMVIAMYHDQGLAAFKTIDFSSGIQLTAGLPFVRTSPSHGTAYEIAGKKIADDRSMRAAIDWAVRLARQAHP